MSQWAEIRHLHLVEGMAKKEIARRLQVDVKTVRRAVEQPLALVRASSPQLRSLDPWREPIAQWLHPLNTRVFGDRCGGPRGEAVTGRLAGRAWAGAAGRGPRPALRRPGGRRRRTRPWARWLPGAARSRPRLPERHDQPIADRHQRADPRWTAREGARESPHALGRRRPVGRVEDPSTPEYVVHDQQAAGP